MHDGARFNEFGVDVTNNNYRAAGVKLCKNCGGRFLSYQALAKFCGAKCYHESKRLPEKACLVCGVMFKPRTVSIKFCGRACALARQKKPKVEKIARVAHILECQGCGVSFRSSPSRGRKYCSYSCHIKHGGAQRAGQAAAMAKVKYGVKKDANHNVVFDMIRTITAVYDLSASGFGVPDGIAWCNAGWQLFDVKNPETRYGKRGLNDRQKRWASDWRGGPVYLIYTVEEAERFARGKFDGLSRFPE